MQYSAEQIKGARKAILKTFKGCYRGEDRASYLKGTEEERIALTLVEEGKLIKSDLNADMGGAGDKRYTYFAPAFDTFDYARHENIGGIETSLIQPDVRMKNWK